MERQFLHYSLKKQRLFFVFDLVGTKLLLPNVPVVMVEMMMVR